MGKSSGFQAITRYWKCRPCRPCGCAPGGKGERWFCVRRAWAYSWANVQLAGAKSRGMALDRLLRRGRSAVRTPPPPAGPQVYSAVDRKSVVSGTSVSVRVDLGGRRLLKKKNIMITRKC